MTAAEPAERSEQHVAPIYRAAITTMTWGFRSAAALLMLGLLLALVKGESLERRVDSLEDSVPAILDGKAAGFIDLAILTIMVTPLFTVTAVALGFHRAGDRRYAVCSLLVLGILGISVVLSLIR